MPVRLVSSGFPTLDDTWDSLFPRRENRRYRYPRRQSRCRTLSGARSKSSRRSPRPRRHHHPRVRRRARHQELRRQDVARDRTRMPSANRILLAASAGRRFRGQQPTHSLLVRQRRTHLMPRHPRQLQPRTPVLLALHQQKQKKKMTGEDRPQRRTSQ